MIVKPYQYEQTGLAAVMFFGLTEQKKEEMELLCELSHIPSL
jgi:hypothetical protein